MNELPNEITDHIYLFIPHNYLVTLNKSNYDKYHEKNRDSIPNNLFHSYIRDMIRRDYLFILEYLLNQYYNQWKKSNKFRYKSSTYYSYHIYLMYYSIEQESLKCHNLLKEKYNTDIKQHKKVRSKKYKWIH